MSKRAYQNDTIVTLKDIKVCTNEEHVIPKGTRMKVISPNTNRYYEGNIEAYVSMYVPPNEIIYKRLYPAGYHTETKPVGVVIDINPKDFLVEYNSYKDEHYNYVVPGIKLDELPYKINEEVFEKSKFRNDNTYSILLSDLIYYIDDAFAQEVEEHVTWRDLTEDEIDSGEYMDGQEKTMTIEGEKWFYKRQSEILDKFEKLTGFTYFFKGGLVWE